ncbi:MAG: chromosome segregation protein SMC [Bacteroidetes bacterium]|nr:MAG: chromosome segregation protein SMC [Bacteroidota bacterium]
MLLKRLEIKGFKSFAEHAVINFNEGVTGIVGPNGCGKSNVVDAIRWVLGEQRSKSLRSDKMENVIFNGTDKRNPAQVAQVTLTFDNNKKILPAEYSTVTITRRYYRSGESEYLLNDVRCRLKDINNLFLDTGIGSDSYAIIELKMVDEILNDKENSRRELFEKAAGVSKFKSRKKETLARLEVVETDLSRVGDLLFEMEKNIKNLERQAKQAERYFNLKKEYKTAGTLYAKLVWQAQTSSQKELEAKTHTESQTRLQITQELDQQERDLEAEKARLDMIEQDLNNKKNALSEHKTELNRLQNEKRLKAERLTFLQQRNEQLHDQIKQDIAQQVVVKKAIDNANAQLDKEQARIDSAETETKNAQNETQAQDARVGELRQQIQSLENRYQQTKTKLFEARKNYEIKQTQLNAAKQELEKLSTQNDFQQSDSQGFDKSLTEIAENIDFTKQDLQEAQEKENRKQLETGELEQEVEALRRQVAETHRTLDRKQNEYNLTKSLIDNMEGFPDALKYLQKETAWGRQFPLLSDIISCEEKYRVGVEAFLEPYLNYYVVNTLQDAFQAIQLLDKAQKGKANFFVLEYLVSGERGNGKQGDGFSGGFAGFGASLKGLGGIAKRDIHAPIPAHEVVSSSPEHEALVQTLLQEVYLVESPEVLPTERAPQASYIALNGQVLRRQYAVTGGSVGAFEGKRLGRVQNLEQLAGEIAELKQRLEAEKGDLQFKEANKQTLVKNQSFREAIKNLEAKLQQLQREQASLQGKREQILRNLQLAQDRQIEVQDRIADLRDALEVLRPELATADKQEKNMLEQVENLRESLTEEVDKQRTLATEFNYKNLRLIEQKNQFKSAQQNIRHQEQTLDTIKQRLDRQEAELRQIEGELEQGLDSEAVFDEQIAKLQSELPDWEATVQTAQQNYYTTRGHIGEVEKLLRELQRKKETQDQLLQTLRQKMHEIDITLAGVRERLSVEFNISVADLTREKRHSLWRYAGFNAPPIVTAQPFVLFETDLKFTQMAVLPTRLAYLTDEEAKELAIIPPLPTDEVWGALNANPYTDLSLDELKSQTDDLRQKIDRLGAVNQMALQEYQEAMERYQFIDNQRKDLVESETKLRQTLQEMEDFARTAFMTAFEEIRENFIKVFRSLFTAEDTADLVLTEPDNPLESKIEIVARPKGKRPLTIDQLSGGEKTLTATSLLFALYLRKPAPFCIFDEVDAPLDDANTEKFNNIIREFSKDSQFIIVTHNKRTMTSTDIMYGVTMIQQGISSVVPVDLRELE